MRPPAYFPGLPYAALLQRADRFVLADTFEHSRRSMQNRARLRTPQGRQWITVPVRRGQSLRCIAEVEIETSKHWRSRHWRALQYDYRSTPYFELYEPKLAPFFAEEWTHLGPCACRSVELLSELAGLGADLVRASRLPGAPRTLPAILDALGAAEATLLSPPDAAPHDEAQLEGTGWDGRVRPFAFEAPRYRQNFAGFEPDLSFADLLFGYGPEARAMLSAWER